MAGNRNFVYTGLEYLTMEPSERPYYCIFKIMWKETGKVLAEIITNKNLKGRWVRGRYEFKQVSGTMQYALPSTDMGVRKALKALAKDVISTEIDLLYEEFIDDVPFCDYDPVTGALTVNPTWDNACRTVESDPKFQARKRALEVIYEAL